uniref:TFIIB-type domain-containing protein n=1 Tax=Oryza punctata TaxID=4537 RepID=A0A0E0LL17_ORYPU
MYGNPDGVRYCQQCERTTSMVLDHDTGDAICTECAIVLVNAAHSEPRRGGTGASAAKHGAGNSGGADAPADDDPLLQGSDVVAAAAAAEVACSVAPTKLQAQAEDPAPAPRMRGAVVPKMRGGGVPDTNKSLAEGFDAIDNMASRLGLADNVRDRGKDVLRKVEEVKACTRGRSRDALYAACLHTACRMEGAPRTLKELISATPDAAATKRDLGKFIHVIKRHLGNDEEEAGQDQAGKKKTSGCGGAGAVVRAGDYLLRYGSAIGMSSQEVSAAQRAANRLDESLDVRRNPQSIAAAIIYMAVQRAGGDGGGGGRSKSVREVSAATGVSESTIKDAYKDLCQHAEHCQRVTPMVLDHATGDAICTECAFDFDLINGNACPEPTRWRATASVKDGADDGSDDDRSGGSGGSVSGGEVVHAAGNIACSVEVLPVLQTDDAVSAPRMRGSAVPRMRSAVPDTRKTLAEGFDAIDNMASRLGLADKVSDRAKEVLRKLEEARACPKGRSRDALYAACLHAACRVEGAPRTLKELITTTADAAATKRDMGKFINAIKRHLGMEECGQDQAADMKTNGCGGGGVGLVVRAGDYLHRYGSAVGMSSQEVSAARRAAVRLDSLDVRRNPQSIAAAIVYMAAQGSGGGRKSVREVSAATGVSESTIKDAYKDLCPHAALLFA